MIIRAIVVAQIVAIAIVGAWARYDTRLPPWAHATIIKLVLFYLPMTLIVIGLNVRRSHLPEWKRRAFVAVEFVLIAVYLLATLPAVQ